MGKWGDYQVGSTALPDGRSLKDVARVIAEEKGRLAREKELVEAGFDRWVVRSFLRMQRSGRATVAARPNS